MGIPPSIQNELNFSALYEHSVHHHMRKTITRVSASRRDSDLLYIEMP